MSLIPKRTLNQRLHYQAMAIKSRNSRLKYVKLTHSDIKKIIQLFSLLERKASILDPFLSHFRK